MGDSTLWSPNDPNIYVIAGVAGTTTLLAGCGMTQYIYTYTGNETTVICDTQKRNKERDHTKYPKISHTTINVTTII